MIRLGTEDYREDFYHTLDGILKHLKLDAVTDEEIWLIARETQNIPHIANIGLGLMASKIEDFCRQNYIEFTSSINATDSHIFIGNEGVHDHDMFVDDAIESQFKNPDFVAALSEEVRSLHDGELDVDDSALQDHLSDAFSAVNAFDTSQETMDYKAAYLRISVEEKAEIIYQEIQNPGKKPSPIVSR